MGDKLKRDLQSLQRKKAPVTSNPNPKSDDSDNTDIDLFENTEQRQSRKRVSSVCISYKIIIVIIFFNMTNGARLAAT